MSRKFILALAAVATLAGAALSSGNADAMVLHRVGGGNPATRSSIQATRSATLHYRHWVRWHKHIWVRPVGYVCATARPCSPAPAPA